MDEKRQRLADLRSQVDELSSDLEFLRRKDDRFANTRLISFLFAAMASGATLLTQGVVPWLVVTVVAICPFVIVLRAHRGVQERMSQKAAWLRLRKSQVARMTLAWEAIPSPPPWDGIPDHPFARDLDLTGDRSLHHLVDTAASLEGSRRLRDWLLETEPDPERILARQAHVRELRDLPSFRDELMICSGQVTVEAGEKWPGERLLQWLARSDSPIARPVLPVLGMLALLNLVLATLNALGRIPPWWVATWLIYVGISFLQIRKTIHLSEDAFFLRDGLDRLSQVFNFLERYPYQEDQHLAELCRPFQDEQARPSVLLKRVQIVLAAAGLQRNQALWIALNAVVPWDIFFAHQLGRRKGELAHLLPVWLDRWFELEALCSLAGFSYLNPEATFPEISDEREPEPSPNQPPIAAQALGHPLLPSDQRVCNDFVADDLGTIYLITGSNMAGKSTFLRTVGVNMALAYAGGPVIATSMRLRMFRLYTAIRVTDSVIDGFSYFYAEVRRLKALLEQLKQDAREPLLFLIDEIFRGTNNRERLIGSRAYVKALAGQSGIGLIATHDLELVNLADEIPWVRNFHFRDEVVDSRMVFDFKLHPGPCPTTNALKIMRQAGLPIDIESG